MNDIPRKITPLPPEPKRDPTPTENPENEPVENPGRPINNPETEPGFNTR